MDSVSRFRNPIPLKNGSLSNPPTNQIESVGSKASTQIILERFRALVKAREEEIGFFRAPGEESGSPLSTDEVVQCYKIVLSELVLNSKPTITDLTIIAGEHKAHAKGIADAICIRIIEVPVDQKLPCLYLLDSIVKNIGKEYVKHFSVHLPEVFCEAYVQVHPNIHRAMRHLFGTWSTVFPSSVLHSIEEQLQFSSSVNGESSGLSSLRGSDSPLPTHGIHVNPKYLEARRQFGNSSVDSFGAEGASSTGGGNLITSGPDAVKKSLSYGSKVTSSSSPYRIGHSGSLLPSVEEFSVDNPSRVAVRASPPHSMIDYPLSRVIGREEEINDWRTRNWQGKSKPPLKTSNTLNYKDSIDLQGPRALINAYGIDEREKNLTHKHQTVEQVVLNGVGHKVPIRTWQNTEEEEFDWEDMTPSNPLAPLAVREANNKIAGMLPNAGGGNSLITHISPSFSRQSLILPQQSQSHFNVDKNSSVPENRNLLAAGDQRHSILAPEIPPVAASALNRAQYPTVSGSSHFPPSFSNLPSQMQVGGQISVNKAGNIISEQHFGQQSMLPQIPSHHPGIVPLNVQSPAHVSLEQPNLLISQDPRQNSLLPSSSAALSHDSPQYYGNFPPGHVPPAKYLSANAVPGLHPPLPNFNAPTMPFHMPGAAYLSRPIGPRPGANYPTPLGQNIGQAPNSSTTGPLSGLYGSLVAQGFISMTKQDSVGLEFDADDLKLRHESAITSLYGELPRQCTSCGLRFKGQEEHSKHMDWHVSKNRTLKTRKTKPSPKWFVSVSMWLHGVEAIGSDAVPGFLPAETAVEKDEVEDMSVPADEDQQACALCGERFDDFYSDETEEWMYKGAVYLHAHAGSTVGMDRSQLGPIVHSKCKSDSHTLPSEDRSKAEDEESAEDGNPRKKLRR